MSKEWEENMQSNGNDVSLKQGYVMYFPHRFFTAVNNI